jgi:hypothetical protein
MVVHTCDPSYSGGGCRKTTLQGQPGQKQKTLSENKMRANRAGEVAQAVECLPSKREALSSIPHPNFVFL